MDGTVRWYGSELLAKIRDREERALYEGAETLLRSAQAKAPEDTGRLRKSGYVATEKRSTYREARGHNKERKAEKGTALAGFAMFYAHMVEFGTSKMAARPFLRPALDGVRSAVGKRIVAVLARELR